MNACKIYLFLLVTVVQGCGMFGGGLEKCHERSEYQDAKPGPLLRVPADLESLSPEARLEIPYGEANTEATPPDQPCLIEPPAYDDRNPN